MFTLPNKLGSQNKQSIDANLRHELQQMTELVSSKERDLSAVLEQNNQLNEQISKLTAELAKASVSTLSFLYRLIFLIKPSKVEARERSTDEFTSAPRNGF